jgi:filamentous hemagglutinin family protein
MLGMGTWRRLLAIALGSACTFSATSATAQITPDRTLPNNSSIIINGSTFNITGGTQAGRNLFHSFQQFSVPTGGTASFNNGSDIQNIISRVTGGAVSNIDGLIRANGVANLFFLNPNGIVFGSNAQLNVGGSFVGSTANAIQFGSHGIFSASIPNTSTPLLTINPSALLFTQINPGVITNQSQAPAGVDLTGSNVIGLRVPDGNSLLLVGGNINLDGGRLTANGGRVELAGLAAPGIIGLNVAGNTLSLSVPSDVQRGNISLNNQAFVSVYGAGGGDVAINAHNLEISNSYLLAGIVARLPDGSSKAGDIKINADSISLSNGGEISNFTSAMGDAGNIFITARNAISLDGGLIDSDVLPGAVGRGGDINIQAGNIFLIHNGLIGSNSASNSDSGNIFITAGNSIFLDGGFINTIQLPGIVGRTGDISIQAGNVSLTDGGGINSSILGQGSSGSINVNVGNTLTISGAGSLIAATLKAGAVGRGGDINIRAGNVSLTDGGAIASSAFGQGNSGNVSLNVRDALTISGVHSGILATLGIGAGAVGRGGDINIQAGNVSLTDRGTISSDTFGQGNSGNINIQAGNVFLTDRGIISSGTLGNGDSGNIFITSGNAISVDNANISNDVQSYDAVGNAGSLKITTGLLSLTNGAQIDSFTRGKGNGGNITIFSKGAVTVDGINNHGIPSGFYSAVESGGVGNGGNINITAESLSLTNGGELGVSVYGASGTFPSGQGTAGDININANTLRLSNGQITAQAASSDGGNINFNLSQYLLLRNGSLISTTAGTAEAGGNGGNITINAAKGFIVAFPKENSDIIANAFKGSGGRVNITAFDLFNIQPLSREDLVRLLGTEDPILLNPQRLSSNNITAISQVNPTLNGVVNIQDINQNPTQGLQLPEDLGDSSKLITQSCPVGVARAKSRFVITGRGGLPPNPSSPLSSDVLLESTTKNTVPEAPHLQQSNSNDSVLVEAQGVDIEPTGEIIFTAKPSKLHSYNPLQSNIGCYRQ